MEMKETLEGLGEELDKLERRKHFLAEAREKLARERRELQPVKDFVAAREVYFGQEQTSLDGEGDEIADALKYLRREITVARKGADRDLKYAQREALAQRKEMLGELRTVEDAIDDLENENDENE
ncbi:MAG TPA: hypothetical protein VJ553_07250 [Candidatus Paceibacterota bacterium]|nr:hypothetical protein [Candidatus Paceibacterota bacterium]